MTDHQTKDKKDRAFKHVITDDALTFLLRWLSPDEEEAGQRYERLRRKLIKLFAHRGALPSVLDELADETLDRAGRRLASGEVVQHLEPMAYLHGVASNVLHEYWRRQQQRASQEIPLDGLSARSALTLESRLRHQEKQQERERWLECLDEFLNTLPPEDEALLRSCYHDDPRQQSANRRAAATRLRLEETGLRARLHRIRQTLERKVRACVERRQK